MSVIKDSGEQTEFETGAVRDMHAKKGLMHPKLIDIPWNKEKEK